MKKQIVLLVDFWPYQWPLLLSQFLTNLKRSDNVTIQWLLLKRCLNFSLVLMPKIKKLKSLWNFTKSLHNLRVFVTENKSVAADMKSTVDKYLKSSAMEELMRVKDKDANVKFYIRQGKDADHVKELLMFVDGINGTAKMPGDRKVETVLLSLTGDIDLNKISTLTKKMNLPSELDKAGNK